MENKSWENIKHYLDLAESNLFQARKLLAEECFTDEAKDLPEGGGETIEGIFNGEEMVASCGKKYPVPANYASKSKLVVGDILKLNIIKDGSFIYKQIKPAGRKKAIAKLEEIGDGYAIKINSKVYRISTAAVRFHKANAGDKVSVILSENKEADWAALENIII